jgi:carbonic anhydrase/acetyltransferase-like protein (isoleucine patch superfamily)
MNDVILRGDLSAISFGVHVYIGADTVIRPCPKQVGNIVGYFELKIGSRVVIEEVGNTLLRFISLFQDCIVLPESMGSNITIEKGSIIGKGCKLGSGCYIKADSVLPPNMVVAPYVIMSGNPG